MVRNAKTNLSASLEDYLEAIFNLTVVSELNVARSRDIAEVLGVSRSSVTGGLRLLGERGLVNYKPYGFITLTDKGRAAAEAVAKRHAVIESFFIDILGVDEETSKQAACKAEHALGAKVVEKLIAFMDFIGSYDRDGNSLVKEFNVFCEDFEAQRNKEAELMAEKNEILLSTVESGRWVKLIRLDAGAGLKSRLAAMGVLPGGKFEVMKNGHPGPFVVKAKGTKMVLGRGMAHKMLVEVVK